MQFEVVTELASHIKSHVQTCNVCGIEFTNTLQLMEHLKNHIENEIIDSNEDIKDNQKPLKQHEANHANDNQQIIKNTGSKTCNLCNKTFAERTWLKTHIDVVHKGIKNYECNLCGLKCGRKAQLDHHYKRIHEGLKEIQCSQCEKSFSMNQDYLIHNERYHEPLSYYECSFCKKERSNRKDMQRHLKKMHNFVVKTNALTKLQHPEGYVPKPNVHAPAHPSKYECNDCNEKFSSMHLFRAHKKEIHGIFQTFDCKNCGQSFKTALSMAKHKKKPHTFFCKYCDKVFFRKVHLRLHQQIHKGEKKQKLIGRKVECTRCSKILANRFSLKIHLLRIHNDDKLTKFSCEICDKKFSAKTFMLSHLKIKHEGYKSKCEFCDMDFSSIISMMNHVRYIHKGLREKCQSCDKSFGTKSSLQLHIKTVHLKMRAFKCVECKLCEVTLTSNFKLKKHMLEYHDDKRFANSSCYYCDKTFIYKSLMIQHMRTEHEQVKDYKCDFCHVRMSLKFNLQKHMLEKHNDERFANVPCHLCEKKFICESHKRYHIRRVHEETKDNYKCEICQKTMTSKFNLQKHMLEQHNDERFANVPCKICDKKFICESHMTHHVRKVHEQAKDYKCDRCGKEYERKGQRDNHYKRVHQGIKEFQCETCEKRFSIRQDLQVHQESFHEPWSYYKCFCGNEFSAKKNIQNHLRNVHGGIDHAQSLEKLIKKTDDNFVKCEIKEDL